MSQRPRAQDGRDSSARRDQRVLDELFERALDCAEHGQELDLEGWLEGRDHLRSQAEELLRTAKEVLDQPQSGSLSSRIPGYRIERPLGAGSMGAVYLARQEALGDRLVALKVLPPAAVSSASARARFLREARALARLRHPGVVSIHDVVDSPELVAYAMEWIEGVSLGHLLQAVRLADPGERLQTAASELGCRLEALGPSWTAFACRIAAEIAEALQAVHSEGLLHRDVKPANILIRRDGVALLSDFGLVRDSRADGNTRTGHYLGTPSYSSPEQLRGDHAKIDERSDLYSLGATLYETLVLEPPCKARSPATILVHAEAGRTLPLRKRDATLPRDLETIVGKCLEPEPGQRYRNARELADDLGRLARMQTICARPPTAMERVAKFLRRHRSAVASGAIAASLAVFPAALLGARWTSAAARDREAVRQQGQARLALFNPGYATGSFGWPAQDASDLARPASDALQERVDQIDRSYTAAIKRAASRRIAEAIALERDTVRLAWAITQRQEPLRIPVSISERAPRTADVARTWHRGVPNLELASELDRFHVGLLAFLAGNAELVQMAWAPLSGGPDSDPFVDAALGQVLLFGGHVHEAARRLAHACEAFPEAGFLHVHLADALVQTGEVESATQWLERAEELDVHDSYDSLVLIRADLAGARGEDEQARSHFEWMLEHHESPYATRRYIRYLESQNDTATAVGVALLLAHRRPADVRVQRDFLDLAERWWRECVHENPDRALAALLEQQPPAQYSLKLLAKSVATASMTFEAAESLNFVAQQPSTSSSWTNSPPFTEVARRMQVEPWKNTLSWPRSFRHLQARVLLMRSGSVSRLSAVVLDPMVRVWTTSRDRARLGGLAAAAIMAAAPLAIAAGGAHSTPAQLDGLARLTQDSTVDKYAEIGFSSTHGSGLLLWSKKVDIPDCKDGNITFASIWDGADWSAPTEVPGQLIHNYPPAYYVRHSLFSVAYAPTTLLALVGMNTNFSYDHCSDEIGSRWWSGSWNSLPLDVTNTDGADDGYVTVKFSQQGDYAIAAWSDDTDPAGVPVNLAVVGAVWNPSTGTWGGTSTLVPFVSQDNRTHHDRAIDQDPITEDWIIVFHRVTQGAPASAEIAFCVGTASLAGLTFQDAAAVTSNGVRDVFPIVKFTADGRGCVFWTQEVDSADTELMVAAWDRTSASFSAPVQLTNDATADELQDVVAVPGGWELVWTEVPAGESDSEMFCGFYDGSELLAPTRLTKDSDEQADVHIGRDSTGVLWLTWVQGTGEEITNEIWRGYLTYPCAPTTYCIAGTTTHGCAPSMDWSGTPCASAASGFSIRVEGVEGAKNGLIFYGINGPASIPWALGSTSTLCVNPPVQRMPVQNSGGTLGLCDGAFDIDWLAYIAANPSALGAPLQPGTAVYAQAWFRDPGAPGGSNLSDALQFAVCP